MVTVQELRRVAANQNIVGRSKMNKAQLCKALAEVGVNFNDCAKGAKKTINGSPRKKSPVKKAKKSPVKKTKKSPVKKTKKSPVKKVKKSPVKKVKKARVFDDLELEDMVNKSLKKLEKKYKDTTGKKLSLEGDQTSIFLSKEDEDNLEEIHKYRDVLTHTLRSLPEKKTEKLYFASYEYIEGRELKFRYMSNYSLLGVKTSRGELAGKILLAMLEMIFSPDINEIMDFSDYEEYMKGGVLDWFSTYFDTGNAKLNQKIFTNEMFIYKNGERVNYIMETKREDTIILDEEDVVDLFWSKLEGDNLV